MTQGQLRTYFAWRTDVRRAMAAAQPVPRPVSSSYAVLYLMELVNGIGTSGPEASCQTAQQFWEAYRRFDFTIEPAGLKLAAGSRGLLGAQRRPSASEYLVAAEGAQRSASAGTDRLSGGIG